MARSIRTFLALLFVVAGGAFLLGTGQTVDLFEQIGLGQWLRFVTGFLALWGGVLLLIPSRVALGSGVATALSLGALLIQAFLPVGTPSLTIVVTFLSGISLVQAQLEQPVHTRKRSQHAA
ncbi:MAG TPA: DoxX family protein [Candidatus Angelobacter sp.]